MTVVVARAVVGDEHRVAVDYAISTLAALQRADASQTRAIVLDDLAELRDRIRDAVSDASRVGRVAGAGVGR